MISSKITARYSENTANTILFCVPASAGLTTPDTELTNSWGVERIGAGLVHASGNRGAGVRIGIIDSGIDYTHPELSANYAGGWQPFWHAMLELKGLAGRYMRAPEQGLPESDLKRVRADIQSLGVAL